jgi:Asp-tRNA(Asn)/Glu-tRNA(Gln) amidotransferase A subunit family amidase
MGGSLRNPASFCGVVGMRPSPGRVARSRTAALGGMLSVEGPMARDVEDVALLLDAMSGADRRDPSSLPRDGASFLAGRTGRTAPRRVAFSRDLGITPVEPEVGAMVEAAAQKLAAAGIIVEEAHPDLSEAHDCFQVLRALSFATGLKDLHKAHGDRLKPEIVWNVEKGLKLTVEEIVKAEQQRVAMFDGRSPSSRPTTCCWRRQRSRRPSRSSSAISRNATGIASAITSNGWRSPMRSRSSPARPFRSRPASPRRSCLSGCRSSARRKARQGCCAAPS